jgi:tRNA-2-methylthio-N6-dimethylallyladenosine synthase
MFQPVGGFGAERSRPVGEIAAEVRSLVRQGVREVTLLGQIVDRYGADVPDGPDLSRLLRVLHDIDASSASIRRRTEPDDGLLIPSPSFQGLRAHEAPVQAGDDEVLNACTRLSVDEHRRLIYRIRTRLPGVRSPPTSSDPRRNRSAVPGDGDLLAELRPTSLTWRYSSRPGTFAARHR